MSNILFSNELRISITNKCNYRCIFCHNDGINAQHKLTENITIIKDVIDNFILSGGKDITFTGGEPLLTKKTLDTLITLINYVRYEKNSDIPITIVTNASNINTEVVNQLKGIKNLKFNISIHSFIPEKYLMITNQKKYTLPEVLNKISLLSENDIKFKTNYVIVKGINNSEEDVRKAIYESKRLGAISIKFIELLVIDSMENMLEKYYEVKSIPAFFKDNLSLIEKSDRKYVYKYNDKEVEQTVEIVKCTCKVGCKSCNKFRPIAIDISGNYYPCFISEEEKLTITSKENLGNILKSGLNFITEMSKQYEELSPILNNDPILSPEKLTISASITKEQYENIVNDRKRFLKTRYVNQNYYIYKPINADNRWNDYNKSVRIRENLNNIEQSALIVSNNEYFEKDGIFISKTIYYTKDNFLFEGKREDIEKLLSSLDYKLEFNYYISGYYIIYKRLRLNVSKITISNKEIYTLTMLPKNSDQIEMCKSLLAELKVEIIREPIFKFLERIKG